MSKQEPADQVKFLVSCIGHTSNGRVSPDPSFVSFCAANKPSLTSRLLPMSSASSPRPLRKLPSLFPIINTNSRRNSQKRYERMLKAHGISRPGALANGNGTDSAPSTPKRKAKAEGAGSAKKRATPRKAKKEESDDDEDAKPKTPASKNKVKKEEEKDSTDSTGSLSGMCP